MKMITGQCNVILFTIYLIISNINLIFRFFVGAPNASDHSLWQPNNTGLVYRCEWSQQASLNTNCYPMDLSKKMNYCKF